MLHTLFDRAILVFVTSLFCTTLSAQIELVQGLTPEQLIEQYLLGPGVTVTNITFNGGPGTEVNEQLGAFYGVNSVLAMDSGLVLATSPISIVEGPNDEGGATIPITGPSLSDPDLAIIANAITYDAGILEFDFVPQADSLSFRFVFGSEEYLEFVGTGYNDAFGFFVSGPGISGPFSNNAINLAVVPGTDSPVTINSINPGSNADYYIDNGDGFTTPFATDPFYFQFDGFTVELEARIAVECGETYHMKMAIADAGDPILDSGVFIKGGTFTSLGNLSMDITTTIGDGDLLEGCGTATLTITRSDASEEIFLPLILQGDASADDINGLPGEVIMEEGVLQLQYDFTAIMDGLDEGSELLIISTSFEGGCSDGSASASVLIVDVPELEVAIEGELQDCEGTPVDLVATATGGYGLYQYDWSDGVFGQQITVPGLPASYQVIVTDECGTAVPAAITLVIPCGIDIPNVFTPDGNGYNEYFEISGIEFTTNTVRIYNRWGIVVFDAINYRNGWDGRGLSDGTYYYEVLVDGHEKPYTGHVTILRKGS